jgi:hypothetical protein
MTVVTVQIDNRLFFFVKEFTFGIVDVIINGDNAIFGNFHDGNP